MRTFKYVERVWDYLPASKRHQIFLMVFFASNGKLIRRLLVSFAISGGVFIAAGGEITGLLAGLLSGTYAVILFPGGGVSKNILGNNN